MYEEFARETAVLSFVFPEIFRKKVGNDTYDFDSRIDAPELTYARVRYKR